MKAKNSAQSKASRTPARPARTRKETAMVTPPSPETTTRKTIEVPEKYYYWVRLAALKQRKKQKDLWAEILQEYFTRHPAE